jgi:hypothetical protein
MIKRLFGYIRDTFHGMTCGHTHYSDPSDINNGPGWV